MASFLVSWFAIPYLSVALSHNQDVRLMASAMPAVAVTVGGTITAVPWRIIRISLGALLIFAGVFQTVGASSSLRTGAPIELTLRTSAGSLIIPVLGKPLGYERQPMPDYAGPILSTIARWSRMDIPVSCAFSSPIR